MLRQTLQVWGSVPGAHEDPETVSGLASDLTRSRDAKTSGRRRAPGAVQECCPPLEPFAEARFSSVISGPSYYNMSSPVDDPPCQGFPAPLQCKPAPAAARKQTCDVLGMAVQASLSAPANIPASRLKPAAKRPRKSNFGQCDARCS